MSEAQAMATGTGTDPATAPLRWVALGDSFTAGTQPDERTWAQIVCEQISADRETELENLARTGARASEIDGRQLPIALALRPTLVTLICGGNDVIAEVRPDLDLFALELDRIYRGLRAGLPGTLLLTATYPAIAPDVLRPRTQQRIGRGLAQLNSIVRELAARHGASCVELAEHPGQGVSANYAGDGIHPSPRGHQAAAAALAPAIESLIEANASDKEAR